MKRFIQNTAYQYINYIWMLLIGLFIPPFLIHHIGLREFGVWALLTAVIRYFELLDFGIETTIIKHISEYESRKDIKSANALISSALLVQTLFFAGTTLLTLTVLYTPGIDGGLFSGFFKGENDYSYAIFMAITAGALKNIFLIYRGVLAGFQKMRVSNTIEVIATIPYLVLIITLLPAGAGINELVTCYLGMVLTGGVLMIAAVKRTFPEAGFSILNAERERVKMIFRFGGKLQVSRLSQIASFHLDKLLVAIFLNVTFVGFYDLGAKVVTILRNFPLIMVSAVTPAVSSLKAKGEPARVEEFYKNGALCLISAGLPFLLFSAVFADEIIHAWIGRMIPESALAARVLAAGYFLNLSAGMASQTATGMGHPGLEMRAGILVIIINPLLSLVCLKLFGFSGVLFATTFSLSAGALYFLCLFNSVISQKFREYMKLYFYPALCAVISLSTVKITGSLFFPETVSTAAEARIFIIATAIPYGVIYYLVLVKTGHLDKAVSTFLTLKRLKAGRV